LKERLIKVPSKSTARKNCQFQLMITSRKKLGLTSLWMMMTLTTERDYLNDPASNSRSFNNSEWAKIKDLSLPKRLEMCLNPTNQSHIKKLKNSLSK
jgi:hypothetical protein